jgi:hypothetical protein
MVSLVVKDGLDLAAERLVVKVWRIVRADSTIVAGDGSGQSSDPRGALLASGSNI